MIDKIYGPFFGGRAALGLLIVRVIFGLGIAQHGPSYEKGAIE
jgi:hypothetical protein